MTFRKSDNLKNDYKVYYCGEIVGTVVVEHPEIPYFLPATRLEIMFPVSDLTDTVNAILALRARDTKGG